MGDDCKGQLDFFIFQLISSNRVLILMYQSSFDKIGVKTIEL